MLKTPVVLPQQSPSEILPPTRTSSSVIFLSLASYVSYSQSRSISLPAATDWFPPAFRVTCRSLLSCSLSFMLHEFSWFLLILRRNTSLGVPLCACSVAGCLLVLSPFLNKQQLPSKFPVLKGAMCWQGLLIRTPPSHTLNFSSGYKIPTSCFVILVLSACFKNKPFVVSTCQSLSVQSLTMHPASSCSLLKPEQRLPCAWQEWLLVLKTAKMQSKALHPAG